MQGDIEENVVAPLVGAWIEIVFQVHSSHLLSSLLSWERGLKCVIETKLKRVIKSLLSWERGLKYHVLSCCLHCLSVAPLVGAWIEINSPVAIIALTMSLLSWERGLKFNTCCTFTAFALVAPLVGAWIEILLHL